MSPFGLPTTAKSSRQSSPSRTSGRGALSRHLVHCDLDAFTGRLIHEGHAPGRLTCLVRRFLEVEGPGVDQLSDRRAAERTTADATAIDETRRHMLTCIGS